MGGEHTPVGRPNQGTPEAKASYLMALRETPFFFIAAEKIGVGESTVRRWRKEDPHFNADCIAIKNLSREFVEASLMKQATGIQQVILYKGKLVKDDSGNPLMKTTYSPGAAKLFLRGTAPEIYNTKMIDATIRPGGERIPKDTEPTTEAEAMQAYLEMIRG